MTKQGVTVQFTFTASWESSSGEGDVYGGGITVSMGYFDSPPNGEEEDTAKVKAKALEMAWVIYDAAPAIQDHLEREATRAAKLCSQVSPSLRNTIIDDLKTTFDPEESPPAPSPPFITSEWLKSRHCTDPPTHTLDEVFQRHLQELKARRESGETPP